MRLDRFIATNTHYSRAQVKKLTKEARVRINTQCIKIANIHIDPETDQITIDDEVISELKNQYIMLNKPTDYICATYDAHQPTVIDLIHKHLDEMDETHKQLAQRIEHLQIVGRLDKDTTGLVLLTDDGQWNHRITSPNSICPKHYHATLAEPISHDAIAQFKQGILLDGETKPTRAATLEIIDELSVKVILLEGKYHQVKRMFAAIGNRVKSLHRESIGNIHLDKKLSSGTFRLLNVKEVASVNL